MYVVTHAACRESAEGCTGLLHIAATAGAIPTAIHHVFVAFGSTLACSCACNSKHGHLMQHECCTGGIDVMHHCVYLECCVFSDGVNV